MTTMYKVFYAIVGLGALGGALFACWSRLYGEGSFAVLVALSVLFGVVYGFINYAIVKAVLRAFVHKFHTLERVLVGTEPPELPNPLKSNEIDEIEASMVRITDQFNKLTIGSGVSTSRLRGKTKAP